LIALLSVIPGYLFLVYSPNIWYLSSFFPAVLSILLVCLPWRSSGASGQLNLAGLTEAGMEPEHHVYFIEVRVSRMAALFFQEDPRGLRYRNGFSSYGWGILTILTILPLINLAAFVTSLYIYWQGESELDRVLTFMVKGESIDGGEDTDDMLRSSLQEAMMLASLSSSVNWSEHRDRTMIIGILALLGGLVWFLVCYMMIDELLITSISTFIGSALLIAIAIGLVLSSRKRTEILDRKDKDWSHRLWMALERGSRDSDQDGYSALGLLLEAIQDVPRWIKARRIKEERAQAERTVFTMFMLIGGINQLGIYDSSQDLLPARVFGMFLFIAGLLLISDQGLMKRRETKLERAYWEERSISLWSVIEHEKGW